MIVSGLTIDGDWRFGKGRANYIRRSDAIRQNVVTRLRSFTNDWYANVLHGIPWDDLLGSRNTESQILREIEKTVLSTNGVKSIERLRINQIDADRRAEIQLSFTDVYDERVDETVEL